MKYRPEVAGRWIFPKRRGYRMMCCDCGLVHVLDFWLVIRGGRHFIEFRAFRHERPCGRGGALTMADAGDSLFPPDRRAAARARCEAASDGPWHVFEEGWEGGLRTILGPDNIDIIECDNNGCASDPSPDYIALKKGNAEFIAHARLDLPAALAELDRLEAENARLRAALAGRGRP